MSVSERTNYAIRLAAETVYEHWRPDWNNLGEVVEAIIETYDPNEPLPFDVMEYDKYVTKMEKYFNDGTDFFEAVKMEGGSWETE